MKRIIPFLVGTILIVILGLLIWLGGRELIQFLKTTDSKLSAAIITAAATLFLGITVAIYSQNRIKKRELEEAHRESKIELYNKFIGFLVKIMVGTNEETSGVTPTSQEMVDFMVEYKRDLILRASSGVIRAQLDYEKNAQDPQKSKNILVDVDKLIREMRKDIGLSNFGMNDLETIQIFLKDKSEIKKLK